MNEISVQKFELNQSKLNGKMNGEKRDSLNQAKAVIVIGGFLMLTAVNVIHQLELQEFKLRVAQLEDNICHRQPNEVKL